MTLRTGDSYDIFLSHASEDKAEVVIPLAETLAARGVRVWFDQQQLTLGDSLARKIDEGLADSRFGAVILSPSFFAKEWPQRELDGLAARETALGVKVILPIWHDITRDDILRFSPTLAGKLAARTSDGLEAVADQILEVLAGPVEAGQVVVEPAPGSASDREFERRSDGIPGASVGAGVRSALVDQRLPELRADIAREVNAAKLGLTGSGDFVAAIDNVVALAGALTLLAPRDPVTTLAVTAPHRIFDAAGDAPQAWQITELITDCWPPMLVAVRALGALLVRLELWSDLRTLAEHPPPPDAPPIYPGWICWMEVQIARRRNGAPNAEHYRQPLRDAASLTGAVEELRKDAPDENATLNSVIAFDFLSRVIETDAAVRAGRPTETFPNFAHFDLRAVRSLARRLVSEPHMRSDLLPGRTVDEVLSLLRIVDGHARAAVRQHGFWDGFADQDLQAMIESAKPLP